MTLDGLEAIVRRAVPRRNRVNFIRYADDFIITGKSKRLLKKVGTLIRKYVSAPMEILVKKLNQTLRGWANYQRHVVASEAFSRIDTYVFKQL